MIAIIFWPSGRVTASNGEDPGDIPMPDGETMRGEDRSLALDTTAITVRVMSIRPISDLEILGALLGAMGGALE